MAFRFEARTQRGMVVDLAVERDPHAAVLVGHRLLACGAHVDDREPAVREPNRTIDEQATAIRASVAEDIAHAPKTIGVDGLSRVEVDDAGKSAHKELLNW
jgi:hypothetical protein